MIFNKLAVIMNPPYQIEDGGHGRSARPIYNLFIETIIAIEPDYLVSINPSRWMVSGKGLDGFRKRMIADHRIKKIVNFPGDKDIFKSVSIKGGVNYFLWDKAHNGMCDFVVNNTTATRFLDIYDIVIQDNNAIPIVEKVLQKTQKWISDKVFGTNPFGLTTNFSNWSKSGVLCHSIRNQVNFCDPNDFTDRNGIFNKWKVATSKAGSVSAKNGAISVISNIFLIEPGSICTMTYIIVAVFDTKSEAENFITYMKTKFFRFMLRIRAITQDINKEKFLSVPDVIDYSKQWKDEDLYNMFDLTKQERAYIESKIKKALAPKTLI